MTQNEVEIPFSYSESQGIYSGSKTATRRIKRYGAEAGMKMRAVFTNYSIVDLRITAVYRQRLGEVSEEDARREGYRSLAAFSKAWEKIHPKLGWGPEQYVWVTEWGKPR